MASNMKENVSPKQPELGRLQEEKSTPPLNVRHWQQSALNHSPPLHMLSPNSIPSLARQRDHSACAKVDSPLKVRKQRSHAHQLNQTSIFADVPPPCMHAVSDAAQSPACPPSSGVHTNIYTGNADSQLDISGASVVGNSTSTSDSSLAAVQEHGRSLRHKSMSRRMLSKVKDVKEGIAQRSRSSHTSIRATDSDSSLIRRISGKRKQGLEEQRGTKGLKISRENVVSSGDLQAGDVDTSGSQLSLMDTNETTDELLSSTLTSQPTASETDRSPSRLRPNSPEVHSPSSQTTPRPSPRHADSQVLTTGAACGFTVTVPHIELSVSTDRDSMDYGVTGDIWVAVHATVRTKVVSAGTVSSSTLRRIPLDVVVLLCENTLMSQHDSEIVHQSFMELCSRLDVPGDRIAVVAARERTGNTDEVVCEGTLLTPLHPPRVMSLLECLGIAPSTTSQTPVVTPRAHSWHPLHLIWNALLEQGLRKDQAQTFIIAKSPDAWADSVVGMSSLPFHLIRIGSSLRSELISGHSQPLWDLEFNAAVEVKPEIFDNMVRDLRHGCNLGAIPSLRICYKPIDRCRMIEVVGQKAAKNVRLGQRCSLFLKVQVPRVDRGQQSIPDEEKDIDSLFTELESIVGTLETEYLHIEARYRHSAFPTHNNVVTIREVCSIKRPQSGSRWSELAQRTDSREGRGFTGVRSQLALFLKANYSPAKRAELMNEWALDHPEGSWEHDERSKTDDKTDPAVVITDTDPSGKKLMPSNSMTSIVPPRTLSAPKTTTAVTITAAGSQPDQDDPKEDSARQLWRHIRRTSLSPAQLMEMSPEKVQQLEASDEGLKALRNRALSNKRSVGAETLRAWRYDEKATGGQAPWL